jgi:hypothetical protein
MKATLLFRKIAMRLFQWELPHDSGPLNAVFGLNGGLDMLHQLLQG